MLTFNRETKRFHFAGSGVTIRDWNLALDVDGERCEAEQAHVDVVSQSPLIIKLSFTELGLDWTISAELLGAPDTLVLQSTLANHSSASLTLGKVYLLDARTPIEIGSTHADIVYLNQPGHISPRSVYPLSHQQCPLASKIKALFFNRTERTGMQVGFLTFRRANTEVEHTYDQSSGLTSLRAWCDFAGWELAAGQQTTTELFNVSVGDDPYALLETWADRAAERCSPRRWEDPPIGWLGWAWVDPFNVERYEDVLLRNCEAVRERLKGFGVNYVWLSLGNLGGTNPGDWLNWNSELFPHGPQYLAARLEQLGFRWGLWCGCFWMCSALQDKVTEFRDALLKNADGSLMVVRPEWQYGAAGELPEEQRPCMYALDPSHPKTHDLLRETFETYRKWGVRYYMIDFLHAAAGNIGQFAYEQHHDRNLVAGPEAYHRGLSVVREAVGDDTYLLSSSGPTTHNAGAMDAIRTGNDFGEGRALYPDSYFYPATYVINSGGFWTGPLYALRNQASTYYTHRRLFINDSGNVLTVDKPIPLEDARIHATIHALSGGPSMLGDDIRHIDEERLNLIKQTLPRSRDVAFPVDLFDSVYPDPPTLFQRRIRADWGEYDVVAVYNFGRDLLRQSTDMRRLRLDPSATYLVWEFWASGFVGPMTGTLDTDVPPGAVRIYRLVRDPGHPVLLGTDMHLLMGEQEITACHWDAETRTLSGTAVRPAGERGSVFIHAPADLRVVNPAGHWIAKDARDSTLIIRVPLALERGHADWSIRFAGLTEPLDMEKLDLT